MSDHTTIGHNVRAIRRYRGLSLDALAGLVGRSKGWLSKVENGHLRLERRSDIRALAEALEVSASDLLGEPTPVVRPHDRDPIDVVRLRDVLLDSSLDDAPDVAARSVDALAELANGSIARQRLTADYTALAAALPPMLAELHVHAIEGDERERVLALKLLVELCTSATFLLRHLGQVDLAWIAADRAARAALLLDDPVAQGEAVFAQAHARRAATLSRALRSAGHTAESLESHVGGDRRGWEVYGMLLLSSALACQVQGDHGHALELVDEAATVAARLGERPEAWQSFGPANVGTWRAMVAVEAGEPEMALAAARAVDARALPSQGRRAALAIETARALSMLGKDSQAVRELRHAEKLSAPRVHHNPLVRELVSDLYGRSASRDVRGLAWRMNLV